MMSSDNDQNLAQLSKQKPESFSMQYYIKNQTYINALKNQAGNTELFEKLAAEKDTLDVELQDIS